MIKMYKKYPTRVIAATMHTATERVFKQISCGQPCTVQFLLAAISVRASVLKLLWYFSLEQIRENDVWGAVSTRNVETVRTIQCIVILGYFKSYKGFEYVRVPVLP